MQRNLGGLGRISGTRRTRLISLLAVLLVVLMAPVPSNAQYQYANIEGTYSVEGRNVGAIAPYQGSVTISRTGETFSVLWDSVTGIGELQKGTGVIVDNVLSVAYSVGRQDFGIAVYSILDNGRTLEGVWAIHGDGELGTEYWTLRSRRPPR